MITAEERNYDWTKKNALLNNTLNNMFCIDNSLPLGSHH